MRTASVQDLTTTWPDSEDTAPSESSSSALPPRPRKKRARAPARPWLAVLAGTGIALAAVVLWQTLLAQQRAAIAQSVQAAAVNVANELRARMEARMETLQRLAARWEYYGQPLQADWEFEVALFLQHHPGYQAIGWVDSNFILRWVAPLERNEAALGLNAAAEPRRRAALVAARDQRTVQTSRVLDLVQGGKGVAVYVPLFPQGVFAGVLSGVFRLQELGDTLLAEVAPGYHVALFDGTEELYYRTPPDTSSAPAFLHETTIPLSGVTWQVQVWPSTAVLAQHRSVLPHVILALGVALAGILSLTVYLAQTAWQRARMTLAANRALQHEIETRLATEAALQSSEERWQLALRGANAGIWDWNLKTNEVFVSARWKTMLGFTENEIDSALNVWSDRVHPEDLPRVMRALEDHFAKRTEFYASEYRLRCKDGSYKWIFAHGQALWDAAGNVIRVAGSHTDITTRKQAAEQLQRYAERIRMLQDIDRAIQRAQSPQAIAQAALPRLRQLIPCLRASVAVFDWEARESILLAADGDIAVPIPMQNGNRLAFTQHPHLTLETFQQGQVVIEEDLFALTTPPPLFALIRASGARSYMSVPLMTPDLLVGALHLVGGAPQAFAPEHQEIAQEVAASIAVAMYQARLHEQVQQQAEELTQRVQERTAALRESETRFRRMFDDTQVPMALMAPDGRYLRVNAACCTLLGHTAEELLQTTVYALTHPEDRQQTQDAMRRALAGEHDAYQIEKRYLRHQSEAVWVSANTTLLHDEQGAPLYFVVQMQDITARKQAEESLACHTRDLERINADLRQVAFLTSHDLLEPLRQMKVHTQRLARAFQQGLPPGTSESMEYVVEGAQRMTNLLRDVQDYLVIELEPAEEKFTDCEEILPQVVTALQGPITRTQAQITHDPLPTLPAAPARLALVFRHLLENALKFHGEAPPRIHVTAQQKDAEWVFAVRDHGIGMEVPEDGRLFHLFQRLQPRSAYPGTGIGLAICKKVIERHGGRIWLESQPGEGTTVYFTVSNFGGIMNEE